MLWLAVQHSQKKALEFFAREIAPAGTGMGKDMKVILVSLHDILFILISVDTVG